jgi:hypothetical protein
VRALAREPRAAGSEAEARARAYCAERLHAAGFDVSEEPFDYSAFPGRWGTPVGGIAALAFLASAGAAGRAGNGMLAILILTLGAALLGGLARWLARTGVLAFPLERRRGVNLIAKRRDGSNGEPRVWLLAHLDSKSQPVPILVRAAGITLLGMVWIAELSLAVVQLVSGSGGMAGAWFALNAVAILAAIPVIATTVGARSPGALDNASGVATVLTAAEEVRGTHVGVCLTSAEELGLAGARAWVRGGQRGGPAVAINCDSVDDSGTVTCMYSGSRPDTLVASVLAAGKRAGQPIRAHRLLPGVLTDGVALADAGWDVVTLSKGGARTLARIHTPLDHPDRLTGTGMDEVARVIVEMLETAS